MKLHGQHSGAGGDQRVGDHSVAGAEIDDEVSGTDPGLPNQLGGPIRVQPVPSPEVLLWLGCRQWPTPCPGHDAP
jgi:hypothetical protein